MGASSSPASHSVHVRITIGHSTGVWRDMSKVGQFFSVYFSQGGKFDGLFLRTNNIEPLRCLVKKIKNNGKKVLKKDVSRSFRDLNCRIGVYSTSLRSRLFMVQNWCYFFTKK
jgi:hypothetical protein